MPMVPDGYCNVLIPASNGGVTAAVTFGVKNNTSLGQVADIADVIWGDFSSTVLALLDSDSLWGPVHVQMGVTGGIISGDGTLSAQGGASINSVPPNTAVLVSKHSVDPGRAGRGRMYWPFAANEGDVDEAGQWGVASVNNFQGAIEDFQTALTGDDLPLVILHSTSAPPSLVTQLNTQITLATQRRRLRR